MQACDRCHSRKTRCDRRFPQCGSCEKAGAACVHADKLRQRNPPRGYIDSLETLVKTLRAENKDLEHSLAQSQAELHVRDNLALDQVSGEPAASPSTSSCSQPAPIIRPSTGLEAASETRFGHNPIAVEVGYLSLVATGETRYLGSSSGLGLANIINTVISSQGGMDFGPMGKEPSPPQGLRKKTFPVSTSDAAFPQLATAMPFIDAYFQHTHVAFPLLHRPIFLKSVKRIYEEPGYYEQKTFNAFVFDMVLAIGSSSSNRFYDSSVSSSTYFAMAQSKVATVVSVPGLQALKAILLVSQHGIFSNLRDTAASMWHLVGIATRMCFELGIHLERNKPGTSSPGRRIVTYEDEMAKRCFWCLYNLDRVVSFTLGRPVAIRDDEIDVSLPSHLDDDCFWPDKPFELVSPRDDGLSPFLHIIRIRRISGEILGTFYNSRRQLDIPLKQKLGMRRKFRDQINAWMADTSKLNLIPISGGSEPVSSFLTQEWYYASKLHQSRRLNYSWITLHGIFIAGLAYVYSLSGVVRDPKMHHALPDVLSIIEVCRRCSNVLVAICERWDASRRSCEIFDKVSTAVIRDVLNLGSKGDWRQQQQQQPLSSAPREAPSQHSAGQAPNRARQTGVGREQSIQTPPQEDQASRRLVTSMTQVEETLAMDASITFPDVLDFPSESEQLFCGEALAGFPETWPFDFPFGTDGALDSSRGDRDREDWFGI
ncbi:unnamed protein product [Clonostachys solani]|uniref:Zn(2)-C6 fungal-type domain-containing protein n=1 Tax=Clonostachys solani TaxID=160281 RepID=A0A9N9ZK10_9HYPO|nr:unnamed protein product [Clonostachys solani]